MVEPMWGFQRETARRLAQMAGEPERRTRRRRAAASSSAAAPSGISIYKVAAGGIVGRTGAALPKALCTLQTIVDETLTDTDTQHHLYNLSPNKIEGTDPSDGSSAMYCLGYMIAGLRFASPMPWKTAPLNIQHNTRWDDDGLAILRTVPMQLPVTTAEPWELIAARDPACES